MPTVNPYCVSGAGSSQVNGTYSYNSATGVWEKVETPAIYFSYDYDYDSFRLIDGTTGGYTLYGGTTYQTNPSLITWSIVSGTSPAPTMASGECLTSPPTVSSISPSTGTVLGGTSVTITGANLTGATSVTIGGVAATSVTVVNSTTITATTPAGTSGSASVLVTTPSGTNAANTLFTYTVTNTIRIKRSSTTTVTPTSLLEGELAANIIDKKIWIGDSSESPVLISDLTGPIIEKQVAASFSSGTLTLDCNLANVFTHSLTANVTTVTINNIPTSGLAIGITLILESDGTQRTIAWPASFLWSGGTAPTITATNAKKDAIVFMTYDAGTTFLAFVAGQNL